MNATWRVCLGLGVVLTTPGVPSEAQDATGAELWRVAGVTYATPFALATGGAAAFWNPAQVVPQVVSAEFDAIETPSEIAATGLLAMVRTGAGRVGSFGIIYGQMDVGDLVRTTVSPDPQGTIPVYTRTFGATWAASRGATTLGATLGLHDTRLDQNDDQHWTMDVGVAERLGDAVRIAAATHFLSRASTTDPSQDLFAGVECRLWHGSLWGGSGDAAVRARYGVTVAHGGGTDHDFGIGVDVGAPFAFDVLLVRQGSYGNVVWRGVAGIVVGIGRYRLSFARDAGVNDIGSAYRVGLEARL